LVVYSNKPSGTLNSIFFGGGGIRNFGLQMDQNNVEDLKQNQYFFKECVSPEKLLF
jgi:hypothetical protein